MKILFILSLIFSLFISQIGFAATVIHAGFLIDGESNMPSPEMTIIIDGKRISSIETGFITPNSDDDYIDLTGYTVYQA